MMRVIKFSGVLLFIAGFLAISCSSRQKSVSYETLKANFKTPPADVRTGVYWYWINDNISVEGVEKDLEAMKAAGITKAFIGNIGGETLFPVGKVRIFTEQWWEVVHAALKKAGELDIEIGMFNCPGWSQSGGPWIKTNQTMRYLNFVDTVIDGGRKFVGKLTPKDTVFEDVRVVAFPAHGKNVIVSGKWFVPRFKRDEVVDISVDKAAKMRSLEIIPHTYFKGSCELQAKVGDEYRTVKEFDIDRSNSMLNVGWDKLAKVVITFPEVEAKDFRMIFDNIYWSDADFEFVISGAERIERYPEKSLAKMFQTPLPRWDSYMWDRETEDGSMSNPIDSVIDISDKLSADGTLTWDVPPGVWMVMRTGMSPTGMMNGPASPEGRGLEVDKMSRKHVEYHFDNFMGEVLRRIPAKDRTSLKYVVQDSYEMGGQNMTDGFLDDFKKRYGYDMTPFLPVLQGYSVGSPDKSDRFLWDLRRLIADKISYDFVGSFAEVSRKNNLEVWLENYGHWGFPGEFLQYGGQSDGIGGEFWAEQGNDRYEPRVAASCGHIYNKNVVSCESFTSGGVGYKLAPKRLKFLLDWSVSEGINEHLLHVYIQQPYDSVIPGIDAWFGTEFNRHNTWFSQLDLFTDYLRRANYMMRQGLNVADVAYFIGEDAPKMTGICQPELPRGYNYDYINAEVILRDMKVRDGKLVLPHGTEYKALVLPPQATVRPELLHKIERLVADGAVVVSTQIPQRSPSLENYPYADREVQDLAAKMWKLSCAADASGASAVDVDDAAVADDASDVAGEGEVVSYYGKGRIYHNTGLEKVFAELNIKPDFVVEGVCDMESASDIFGEKAVIRQSPVIYTHRTDGEREIYFVANQTEKPIDFTAKFRVSGKQPELWNTADGSVRPLPLYSEKEGITAIPLHLDNLEGYFIVFVPAVASEVKGAEVAGVCENFPSPVKIVDISTDWTVAFQTDSVHRGVKSAIFAELNSWSENENPQIKYYSGTATYSKTITVSADIADGSTAVDVQAKNNGKEEHAVYIEFEDVCDMAKVRINGEYAGGCWTPPYRVNISGLLKEGENTVEVEVVNKWGNRLIGDASLPFEQRKVRSYCTNWTPEMPLQTSGLIGRVSVVKY
ncbi:MAG: glycoside hydrolase family 2 [Bacteroidales bacterium]|nr:glycoside hydrolase family 2 [Bacteroidales bacterium]